MEGIFGSLIPEVQHALKKEGYATPTPVQAKAIPPQIDGRDLFGSAQTGTGKTAAFTIPLLQELAAEKINPEGRRPRALILAPTRELAAQIGDSITAYGRFLQVSHTVIFGGVGQGPQEKAMNRGVDIVVATPGRLLDLMGQGFVQLDAVKTFILDEADRMLDMGFIPDVERILAKLPKERQTGFFSATLPTAVEVFAKRLLVNPARVTINPEQPTVEKICQRLLYVGLSLQVADTETESYLLEHMPQLRSRMLMLLSGQSSQTVATQQGKESLKAEILELFAQPRDDGQPELQVDDVLFTEFIVQ